MWDKELNGYLEQQTRNLLQHYQASREKYLEIWEYYKKNMPVCIRECADAKNGYSVEPARDGPQGIYWIGKDPAILFVGRDHYGWYGESKWPDNINDICYSPLQFSYYTVESMGTYWAIIKDIIDYVFKENEFTWNEKLEKVSFSNACKCLSDNSTYQWHLHSNCLNHKYVATEILSVNAKVNVLFTKSYDLIDKLFEPKPERIFQGKEFTVRRYGSQIIIECAHPGRQSHEWRDALKNLIQKHLN